MRDEIISGLIFAVILGLLFLNIYMVNHSNDILSQNIKAVVQYANDRDFEKMKDSGKKLKQNWTKHEKMLMILSPHTRIDMIDKAVFDFWQSMGSKDYEEVKNKAIYIEFLIKKLAEDEKLCIDNIF